MIGASNARLVERQQREIALHQVPAEAADAMKRTKDELLGLVSHELRATHRKVDA